MMKFIVAAALGGAVPATAPAALPDANPAMWVVKDADTTIYLFGTIHVLDGRQDWFNDEVKAAFDASEEVVLEARLPESPSELQPLLRKYIRQGVDHSGRTLSSKLPADIKAKYDKALSAAGVPPQTFEPLKPWFASMAMTQIVTPAPSFNIGYGPEAILTQAARARGMPIGELEGMEYQLRLFDAMPEAQQVALFGQMLDGAGKTDQAAPPMLVAWSAGDADGLARLINASIKDDGPLYDLMFTSRNRNWAEWIRNRLDKPGTVFVAVGAGHLAGKNSVQQLLGERGILSERVA
ncbi:MAG TPA: TraB/GumN family protein [Allosphingosinicella sp.]|nr:TraB/GumN family protein [Allosphingosinicella sp.]